MSQLPTEQREHWGSRFGFILAAAGSAVGLGNIWRFPYTTGENGGGAFLIIYLGLVFTIGLSLMLVEFVVGRRAQKDPVGAFGKLKGGPWKLVGYMGVVAAFVILSFYSVVAGWTIEYLIKALSGAFIDIDSKQSAALFGGFISDELQPLVYHGIFMAMTMGVVIGGVGAGIERASKILMPLLFLVLLFLIYKALMLPGAEKGVAFFLNPDFSKVTWNTVTAALSQAFFSLSLGAGTMITYGSYLKRDINLGRSAVTVCFLDTGVAVLAGLLILPAVFAFGVAPSAGPGLTFISLPAVFGSMDGGVFFASLFFFLLLVAALTSALSLLEVVIAYFVDEVGMSRKMATLVFGVLIFAFGIPSSLSQGALADVTVFGLGFLDLMDTLSSKILMPIGAILSCIFVGWVIWPDAKDEVTAHGARAGAVLHVWGAVVKVVAPVAVAWIFVAQFL
jgi:NSS family neurotransmitter:Na+ symporter